MKAIIGFLVFVLIICVVILVVGKYVDIKIGKINANQNANIDAAVEKIVNAAIEEKLKDLDDKIKKAVKEEMKKNKIKPVKISVKKKKVPKKTVPNVLKRKILINEGIQVLSRQVLVKLKKLCCYGNKPKAYFEVTLPSMETKEWDDMENGTRRQFEYNNKTYFFDVMDIEKYGVTFIIKERLTT